MRRIVPTLLAGMLAVGAALLLAGPAAAATGLPADPAADGYIGLCDETGHNVTGGSITTSPFVWKAVSSTAPPAQYQGAGQNVILDIFQARPGTLPGDWSGGPLTAASFYSGSTHPSAQSTYADESLSDFMVQYPPLDNGLYVLRMSYGKQNFGLYDQRYPTTTIQVVGTSWHVVSGGTVDCRSARATSYEQMTGVATKAQVTPRRAPPADQTVIGGTGAARPAVITGTPVAHASTATGAAPANPSGTATATPGGTPGRLAQADRSAAPGSGSLGWVWFVVVPAAVIAVLALLLWRRRGAGTPSSSG